MRTPRFIERGPDYIGPAAFALFSVLGAFYIISAKFFGLGAIWVTSVPVLLMAVYALAIVSFRRLRLRDDQTGDNFYYMGFIFTLTSLAVSLVQYGSGVEVTEIIQNFGVAVSTTIAGIVFRILFNLTRRDPIEVEHIARLDLADASRQVRRELDSITLELTHFRRTNQQMLAEGFEEIRAEVRKSAETAGLAIDETAHEARERFSAGAQLEATAAIAAELQRTAGLLDVLNESLESIAIATQETARVLAKPRRLGLWARLSAYFNAPFAAPQPPPRPARAAAPERDPDLSVAPEEPQ